jgi:hypothetical protein
MRQRDFTFDCIFTSESRWPEDAFESKKGAKGGTTRRESEAPEPD